MKKFGLALAGLALLLTMLSAPACADYFATIDGRTSDRVHLREGPGTGYASMGLYFTGTNVICYGTNGDWTRVSIGEQTGYMMSAYLSRGTVVPRQPSGFGWSPSGGDVAVYQYPQERTVYADIIAVGEAVTVLGETRDGWYYVQMDDATGYVLAGYLRVEDNAGAPGRLYGVAYVAGTSDRVHLREGPSANTVSLGLYFNGTAVTCLSERNGTWMRVRIGSQTGYMMSRYLSERTPVNRQPTGYVTHVGRNSSVHLRATPGGTVVTSLPYGSELTVLGETHDGWYYAIDDWGDEGYMSAAYVRVED